MATFNLTAGGDWFIGGSADDTFISMPQPTGNGSIYSSLQTFDYLDGGTGYDVLNATLLGSSNYEPSIQNIEEFNLRTTNAGNGYLNLTNVSGVDVINVTGSTDDTLYLYDVGEFNNFGFHDNNGDAGATFYGIDASEINLEFTNTGESNDDFNLDLNANGEDTIETLNIDMLDSYVDIDAYDNGITSLNINSEGTNTLDVYSLYDHFVTDLSLTGTQGGEIEIDANFTAIENVNAGTFTGDIIDLNLGGNEVVQVTTGSGSDEIDFSENLKDDAVIITGKGGDDLDGQDIGDGVSISTGKGHDDVDFDEVFDGVSITTGKGDDDVDLDNVGEYFTLDTGDGDDDIYTGDIDNYANIATGAGSDYLYTGDIGDNSSIDTGSTVVGDGDDTVYIYSHLGVDSSIMTGEGNDVVELGYKYGENESASIGSGSVIDMGNGTAYLDEGELQNGWDYLGVHGAVYAEIGNEVSISTGDGDDAVILGTKYTESDSHTEYNDGSWYQGNYYENEITYNNYYGGVTIGDNVSITTGAGDDVVVATAWDTGADVIVGENSTIGTGQGDDVILLAGEDSVQIGDGTSINTGDGSDDIIIAGFGIFPDTATVEGSWGYDNEPYYYGPYEYGPYTYVNGATGTEIGSNVTIDTGSGDDFLQIGEDAFGHTEIGYGTSISTGDGSDTVIIQEGEPFYYDGYDALVGNDVSINTGADNDYMQIFGDVGDYATIDTGTGDDALDVYGEIQDEAVVSMGDGNDTLWVEDDIQNDAVVSMGAGSDTVLADDDVWNDALISMGSGHDTLMIEDEVASSAIIDGGLGNDTIGLSSYTVYDLSDGGSNITNFESIIIDFSENDAEDWTFDMAELGDINDVTFVNGYFDDVDLTGITSGANVNLTDGGGTLDIDMEDQVSDVLNLSTTNESDTSFDITADLIETINIEADADGGTDVTHTIDLSANAVETVNVTGDAHVVLDSSLGTVTTLTAGNGGVEADLSGETNTRTVTTGDGADTIITDSGSDTISTGKGGDTIESGGGADTINAGKGHDTIDAGDGKDVINAGKGDDTVIGGGKADTIDLGLDSNNDTLVYEAQTDSAASNDLRDTVSNFISGDDQIDLTQVTIDGDVDYIGDFATKGLLLDALSGGEDNSEAGLVSNASVQKLLVDVNGDGGIDAVEDMEIVLNGVTEMTQDDFIVVD